MPLTPSERALFTTDQLTQIDRTSAERLDELLSNVREKMLARLVRYSPTEIRAQINIVGVDFGSSGPVVRYHSDSDYSATEQQTITDSFIGGKWGTEIPRILARGLSIEQRLQALGG